MFLQRYVHVVLDAVLGSYVKNIDPKALQISVWNGKIEVETVELQPDAFPLPKQMRLVKGTLRQLRIDLPWTNLAGQPIRVDIEDVSLLLEVCTDDRAASDAVALTPEEQRRAARKKQQNLQRKRAAIDAVEKATEFNEQNNAQTDAGQSWTQSFLCKLLVKALDNVQVHVQHLHLRMEDAVSDPGCPYAVGMTLEAIIIKSADEGWNYTMVGRGTSPPHGMSFIRKKMDVNKFGIYWSLPLVPVPETALNDAEAFAALMRSSFKPAKKQTQPQVVQPVPSPLTESARAQDATMPTLFKPSDYIVHPLTVSMKLTVNDGNAKLPITHQELSERVLSRLGTSWMVETIDAIGDDAWNDFLKTMPKLAGERKYTLGFVFSEAWSVARDLTEEEDEIPSVLQFKRALSSCMQWSLEEVDRVEQCIIKYREAVVHVMEEKSTYIDAQASIDQISTSLHRQQYLSALSFISFFTVMRRQARYLVLRPNRIRVRNDPKAWWRYAINAMLLDIRERLAHVDWGALETKQRQKDRYKKLCILVEHSTTFAATLVLPDMRLLSKEIARSELEDLEYVMDVQELIKLRRAVRKEIADTEKAQQALQSNGGSDYKSGGRPPLGPESSTGARLWSYATWLTGAGGSAHGSTDHGAGEVRVEDVKWSDQDANDLYKAIDFHPKREKEIEELGNDEVEDVAEREKQLLQNHQHILYRFQLTLCRASFELSLEDVHTDLRDHKGYSNVELSSSSCLTASLDDVEIQFLGPRLSVHDGSSLGKRVWTSTRSWNTILLEFVIK
uniref:Chorein N-terminal domain-containing protein n=1 Tax=Hyaloperonospora arabidopsidis (strain Emoy2) TaxID=559515 RepID=M4BY42_HYAAE